MWCLCPFQMEYQQTLCLGWGQRHEITLGSSLSFLHHFWHKTDPACMLSSHLWAIISWIWAKPKLKPSHEKREKREKTPYSFRSTHHLVYCSETCISMPVSGLKDTKTTCPSDFFLSLMISTLFGWSFLPLSIDRLSLFLITIL